MIAPGIYLDDCMHGMRQMDPGSVHCCVTSPPYWGLRDYGTEGQFGLEPTFQEYVDAMGCVFAEVWRVLRDDGTLWLNMGDCYHSGNRGGYHRSRAGGAKNMGHSGSFNDFVGAPNRIPQEGLKDKDLVGMPWRVAFALQAQGWYLRSDIIWHKPNPMPESVQDRPTKAHEYLFLLTKSGKYYYDADAIAEETTSSVTRPPKVPAGWDQASGPHGSIHRNGRTQKIHGNLPGRDDGGRACNKQGQANRNKRSVWTVPTQPFPDAHFAVFPEKLITPCILAGCPPGGTVLDPFMGAGTTAVVAAEHDREYIGFELNPEYVAIAKKRLYARTRQTRLAL